MLNGGARLAKKQEKTYMARSSGFKKYDRATKDFNRLLGAVIGVGVKGAASTARRSGRRRRSESIPSPGVGLTWADIPRWGKITLAVIFGFSILVFVLVESIT